MEIVKMEHVTKIYGDRNIEIEMDGGASPKNFKELKEAGTDIIVAGSAVFKAEDPAAVIEQIHNV